VSDVCVRPMFRGPSLFSSYQILDDGDQDGPQNVGLTQMPGVADGLRRFH
jgi:hypothetical protein